MRLTIAIFALCFTANASALKCEQKASATLRPLVELFTSESCSSCPPADQWLSAQKARVRSGEFSAIAWHVDYWDYLSWKDPYSMAEASERQRWLAKLDRAQVYTPGVFQNGKEWRAWRSAEPQSAGNGPGIALKVTQTIGNKLSVAVDVTNLSASSKLYVGTQLLNQTVSIPSGENAGKTLKHDFTVDQVQSKNVSQAMPVEFDFSSVRQADVVFAFLQNVDGSIAQSNQLFLADCAN